MKTKIFLDSGNPQETEEIKNLLGFLDGQTTNPTLVSKNPKVSKLIEKGEMFSESELLEFYKKTVKEISNLIPEKSISIEVSANKNTDAKNMFLQAKEMSSWVNFSHIKFPITKEGIASAKKCVEEGINVNMTLCFSQEQAAAVFSALSAAKGGQVFISPFVGRLDDKSENGMDLIYNILKMKTESGSNIEVLTASVRNLNHFMQALKLESDIITAPFSVLKEWAEKGQPLPSSYFNYDTKNLKPIEYKNFDISKKWEEFNISHPLTEAGLEKFNSDWRSIIEHIAHST